MANRKRPIIMRLAVTEYEKELIERKMTQLGTKNMGAYLRKMAIDGYIIKVDYTQQKKLAAASAVLRQTSTTFADASIPLDTSMRTMLPS